MDGLEFVDLSGRTKLRFTRRQALWFLDQLITNQVLELPAGRTAEALLLTPKGRIVAMMRVCSTDEGVLADFDDGELEDVYDFFSKRVFATKVSVDDVTDRFRLWRVLGDPETIFARVGARWSDPADPQTLVSSFEHGYAATLHQPMFDVVDLWVEADAADDVSSVLEAAEISAAGYENFRVERGLPSFARDLANGYLPQEAAQEKAVHFKKGCYLGQEAVAMTQRGKVRRRLRHLEFTGEGTVGEATFEGQLAGHVTSVGGSHGIGMMKTTIPLDSQVEVQGDEGVCAAVVRRLPGTVDGPSVPSARELRERLRGAAGR